MTKVMPKDTLGVATLSRFGLRRARVGFGALPQGTRTPDKRRSHRRAPSQYQAEPSTCQKKLQ